MIRLRTLGLLLLPPACLVPAASRADGAPQDGQLMTVSITDGQVIPTNASVYAGVWGAAQVVQARVTQGTTQPDVTGTQVGSDAWGSTFTYRLPLGDLSPDAGATVDVRAPLGERLLHVRVGPGSDDAPPVMTGTPTASASYVDRTHYNVVIELDPPADDGGIGYYVVNLVDGGTMGYQAHDADARTGRTQVFLTASGAVTRPCYVVVATDLAGNASQPSAPACVDLSDVKDASCGCAAAGEGGPLAGLLTLVMAWLAARRGFSPAGRAPRPARCQ